MWFAVYQVGFIPRLKPMGFRLATAVSFPRGSLIIAHADGDRISSAETVLEPGDRYLVAVEAAVTEEVMHLLRG
jgi:trk system potassium uptake protein TrkA